LTLDRTPITLDVGSQQQLSGIASTGCPTDSPPPVSWTSSTPSVASVTTAGIVTALSQGEAIITASALENRVNGTVRVTVRQPQVLSITPSVSVVSFRERQTARISAAVAVTGQLSRRVSFSSRSPATVSVRVIDSVSAEITALAVGSTILDVSSTSDSTKRVAIPVTVGQAIAASIRVAGLASTDSVLLSARRQLSAVVRDSTNAELTGRVIRWASGTPSTLSVSASGEIQATRAGVARVIARTEVGDGSGDRVDTLTTRVYGVLDIAIAQPVAAMEEGRSVTLQTAITATAGIDRTLDWESARPAVATVSAAGVVTAVSTGSAVIRVRARALSTVGDSVTIQVLERGIPTSMLVAPRVDTLSPNGTRVLQATVRDQRGAVLQTAPVTWRSLTPALATVNNSGLVTATAVGDARIVATSPRASGTDSLADTARVLVVSPCSLVRPVVIGATYLGRFDLSSCANYIGFALLDQFSVTTPTQAYFSVSLTPSFTGSLIPLNIGTAFFGLSAPPNATIESLSVIRAGTFGFMVAAISGSSGPYTLATSLDPDPRRSCVVTNATLGVTFQTAVSPSCISRDIRILPFLSPGQRLRVTASAASFPVAIELRSFNTGALLASASATSAGGVASIDYTLVGGFTPAFIRVIGGAFQTDLVAMTIN